MMLHSVARLRGYHLHATDGEIGKVQDFLFDDTRWEIRYVVADLGNWLASRLVLVPAAALKAVSVEDHAVLLSITRDQVQQCPGIDADPPVSRQQAQAYAETYRRLVSQRGLAAPDIGLYFPQAIPWPDSGNQKAEPTLNKRYGNQHLRSAEEVSGYHLRARDGEFGHVEDFIVDDESWSIWHIVVDTRNWWPGRKVLLSPYWVLMVNWSDELLVVDLQRATIAEGPLYEPATVLDHEYHSTLTHSRQRHTFV